MNEHGSRTAGSTLQAPSPGARAWANLFEVMRVSKNHMAALAAEFELTPQQLWALRGLALNDGLTMTEFAIQLGCDASNVTGLADKLEARGFVERKASPADRRAKMLVLTAAGRELHDRVGARMQQPPPAIANLSEADQKLLADVLDRALASAT